MLRWLVKRALVAVVSHCHHRRDRDRLLFGQRSLASARTNVTAQYVGMGRIDDRVARLGSAGAKVEARRSGGLDMDLGRYKCCRAALGSWSHSSCSPSWRGD